MAAGLSKPKKPKNLNSTDTRGDADLGGNKKLPASPFMDARSNPNDRFGSADLRLPGITPRAVTGTGGAAAVSPGLGTGGAVATGTGVPGTNPQPYSTYADVVGGGTSGGFAGNYSDLALNSGYLYDHPDVIAADILKSMGITNPEMIDLLTKQADLGYALQFILQGGANQIPSQGDITNFVADYVTNLMSPGGASPDLNAMMAEILNADPTSPLGQYMAQNGPDAVNNLIMSAAMATTNPYYQNALKGLLGQQATDYASAFAKGSPPDSYYQGLSGGPLGGYFGR